MFISIKLISDYLDYESSMYELNYLLEDDDFVMKIHVPIERDIYEQREDASVIPSGLISTYKYWGKNIPKNLALFYAKTFSDSVSREEKEKIMIADMVWTDEFFPECEFGKKYFKCTMNQLKLLDFTGKAKDAKPISGTVLQENQ